MTDYEIQELKREVSRLCEENKKLRKENDEIRRASMTVFERLKDCTPKEVAYAIAHMLHNVAPIKFIDWFNSHDPIDTTWFD